MSFLYADGAMNSETTPPYDDPNDAMSNPTAGGLGDRNGVIRRTRDLRSADDRPADASASNTADGRDRTARDRNGVVNDGTVRTTPGQRLADRRTPDDAIERPRLMHLDDASDLHVADSDVDIRGWAVRTSDGQQIGTVTDLVVDTRTMKVRYLEAMLRDVDGNSANDHAVLLSITNAHLDATEDVVILNETADSARQLPTYARDAVTRVCVETNTAAGNLDDRRFFGGRRHGREQSGYIASLADHSTEFSSGA